jgi:hypothetical protein
VEQENETTAALAQYTLPPTQKYQAQVPSLSRLYFLLICAHHSVSLVMVLMVNIPSELDEKVMEGMN